MDLQTEQTTLPEPSLRDEIAKNLADVSTPVETVTEPEKIDKTQERARDETGKFVAKTEPVEKQEQEVKTEVKSPPRPSSWKKEYWAKYDKIAAEDPELAKYLNEREHQFASGVSTYKQEWEQAKPLIDAIAPFQPILQQHGIDPAQWVSNLGNAHQRLAMGSPQDKIAMFQQLARDYQVPVQLAIQDQQGQWQLLGQQPQQQPQFDPSMVSKLVQQELMAASTQQALQAFEREVPEKYQHYQVVKATMAGLLQAGLADDLPGAYEAALRHPRHADLFAEMQQQQSAQQEAEAKAAKQAKVTRARSNAVSTGSATPGAIGKAAGERGLRDEIAENLRAIVGGRV